MTRFRPRGYTKNHGGFLPPAHPQGFLYLGVPFLDSPIKLFWDEF